MKESTLRIHFHDECPKLGSGIRTVTVKKGRKWVYLTDCMGRRQKITHAQLEALLPKEQRGTASK